MSQLGGLLERLDLEPLDIDLFRGFSPHDGRPRIFGRTCGGRGSGFGHIYRDDGVLVAPVAQKGLMRIRRPK